MNSKTITLVALLSFSHLFAISQTEFKVSKDGINPIILQIDSMSKEQIYEKSKRWIQETYRNPEKVLKTDFINEKLRVDGYQENACWVKGLGNKIYYGLEYSFTIEVKDNRVRLSFEPINLLGGTNKSPFIASSLYNDQGELRGYVKDLVPSLEETMKGLKDSYAKYVSKSKKDEW